ncbi:hypothetical protein [Thalassoroseus pseudoceratinae]|uniref:hypothetical protein n=1 Tax=Thalassoroseus pseudoceratinae TaxID=2713176 RepID=UPI00141F29AB|nr:hypothetical protein [Thalassoroseus pseudoceratinae]
MMDYCSYHETIARYRSNLCMARFEDVISDFGNVVRAMNDQFGTDFDVFEHTPENVDAVKQILEVSHRWWSETQEGDPDHLKIPWPAASKKKETERFADMYHDASFRKLRLRCEKSYELLAEDVPMANAA